MKKYVAMVAAITCVFLSGCSAEELKDKPDAMMKNYLLHDNSQYNEYLNMKELNEENVDADGYYFDEEIAKSELESHPGMIHVSFASNSLLTVRIIIPHRNGKVNRQKKKRTVIKTALSP